MSSKRPFLAMVVLATMLAACSDTDNDGSTDYAHRESKLKSQRLGNLVAYIPPQCYTKTEDESGGVHNPCYTCHVVSQPPNFVNDLALQVAFDFPDYATENHWLNLFEDRTAQVAAISDEEIVEYVRNDNYMGPDGKIILSEKLSPPPTEWDFDGDGRWGGYTPDCYFAFDEQGFDRDPDGSYTGWRVFAYAPFPGTFWPTNGSTDDVLIRLSPSFRNDEQGNFDLEVYRLNLAIVEALITRKDVNIDPVYEPDYGVDLNKDDAVSGMAERVVFDWDPRAGRNMSYVGAARQALASGNLHLAAGLYPKGTEFLHSIRYIDVDDSGDVKMAARMKELRYAQKRRWFDYATLLGQADHEVVEKKKSPSHLRKPIGNIEYGIDNKKGWAYQGFIEDAHGALRPQTFEENVFCIGCHSGIGITTDTTFAFPRKFSAASYRRGWYHWMSKDLRGAPEPTLPDGSGEYARYLEENGAGDELRENFDVIDRFYTRDGKLKPEMLETLRFDISELTQPSRARALELNKAYRVIVGEQSFRKGRDATVTPAVNVHRKVEQGQATGVSEPVL